MADSAGAAGSKRPSSGNSVFLSSSFAKRPNLSFAANVGVSAGGGDEGFYMAALKGSHSSFWSQQQHGSSRRGSDRDALEAIAGGGGGGCFKCGGEGHWAKDCPSAVNGAGFGNGEGGAVTPDLPCPCGAGNCVVRTSNTVKNPGRKFYKCPLRDETGGCGFFKWCDNLSPNATTSMSHKSNNHSNIPVPDLACSCGAGSCLVLVARTEKNAGRQFYRCPLDAENGSCGFFKWCSDEKSSKTSFVQASKSNQVNFTATNPGSIERSTPSS